jgi:hypothetical protein
LRPSALGVTVFVIDGHPMKGRALVLRDATLWIDFPNAVAGVGEVNVAFAIDDDAGAGMGPALRHAEE